jgi:hypothetical protein
MYKLLFQKQQGAPKHPADLALEYMDMVYGPLYGDLWPALRLALLSTNKYCALANHRANDRGRDAILANLDVYDIITKAAKTRKLSAKTRADRGVELNVSAAGNSPSGSTTTESEPVNYGENNHDLYDTSSHATVNSDSRWNNSYDNTQTDARRQNTESILPTVKKDASIGNWDKYGENQLLKNRKNVDLGDFVPTDRVVSYRDKRVLRQQELAKLSVFDESGNVAVPVLPDEGEFRPPPNLSVLTFSPGDTTTFPSPQPTESGLLGNLLAI